MCVTCASWETSPKLVWTWPGSVYVVDLALYKSYLHQWCLDDTVCFLKESYLAQNSLELNSPPGSPYHSMQNKELSHLKEKMDIKVDYDQLPASPASGWSPEFLAPASEEITTRSKLGEEQTPLRQ